MGLQREKSISYLFIPPDIATVAAFSEEGVVMNQGAVVAQGSKEQIMPPAHPEYTERRLSSVPDMDPDWLTKIETANA